MHFSKLITKTQRVIKTNSPTILTTFGVTGTLFTAYLTAKATFKAADRIRRAEEVTDIPSDKKERIISRTKLVWDLYVPAATVCTTTVVCIIMSNKSSSKRTAAVATAYSLSDKAFSEYREKVVEKIGENKERQIRDEIMTEKVEKNPPKSVIVTGSGNVLCYEAFTGRYFESDMETLRRAQNDINAKLLRDDMATLSDFYYMVGLPYTSSSSDIGWVSDKLMELQFTTMLSKDSRPCLAFDYSYTKPL